MVSSVPACPLDSQSGDSQDGGDRYKLARAHLCRLQASSTSDERWLFDMDNQLLTLRLDLLFSYE